MKLKSIKIVLNCVALIFLCSLKAQEIVTPEQAVKLALENNYGIKIIKNNAAVAKNNTHIQNSGYLPSIVANAGGVYNVDDTEAEFSNGDVRELSNATSSRYNASIGLNYVLFDGLGRKYNYQKFKEQYQLSELQTRETIENTVNQLFTLYYKIAQMQINVKSLRESLEISKDRVKRASYQFEYGQNTKLGVLNAQLDYNNDSIQVINLSQQIKNVKRNFNSILGNQLNSDFNVDTEVNFNVLANKEELYKKAKTKNTSLLAIENNIRLKELDLKLINAEYFPKLNLNTNYNWNLNNNNAAAFLTTSTSNGLSTGINLTWNLFEGRANIAAKNRKLSLESEKLNKENILINLEKDFYNAWDDYQIKLLVFNIQEHNIKTAQNNFNRTQEKFKLGQINSIEFRQAQLNLLNVEVNKNNVKYQAKLAELQLLYLSGELLNTPF
ncbi:TolC family protein [Wenyingzhuangia sp. IMCC45533]